MYDVRRGDSRHTSAVNLPPSSFQLPDDAYPEVRTAKWSPDGIFLAVGKNDDVVDVYDVRGLGRGPVLSMRHKTHRSFYGITVLEWTTETGLRTPNLGLLTGGGDRAYTSLVSRGSSVFEIVFRLYSLMGCKNGM